MVRTIFRLAASVLGVFGLSSRPLYAGLKAVKTLAHRDSVARRRALANARPATRWRGFVDPDKSYAPFDATMLPGIDGVVAACGQVFQDYRRIQADAQAGDDANKAKEFFHNILRAEDLARYPVLLEFATSDAIVDAAIGYLGQTPILRGIGVYYSPANTSTTRSQMFHVDGDDFRQLKCFINVAAVDHDNGPFTLIAGKKSDEIRKRVKHGWRDRRLTDDEVLEGLSADEVIRLTGPPGGGALVDTSACLHYGSRARRAERVVFMFQYTTFPSAAFDILDDDRDGRPLHRFDRALAADDPTKRLLLFPDG
jgi:hypothetical protein